MASWDKHKAYAPLVLLWCSQAFVLSGCDDDGSGRSQAGQSEVIEADQEPLTGAELLDPKRCQPCHPEHYDEWAKSMHAYASEDPVFIALNQKGQRETEGELGDFCVQCHAPVAQRLGLTSDGLNLSALPSYAQGVTCAYCHQVSEVTGEHSNQLTWANDGVMRGPLRTLTGGRAHRSKYSPHLDRSDLSSSDLCGACHDIVTPTGLHLERTYWEWRQTLFNDEDPRYRNTCNDCHMPRVQTEGGRRRSSHLMPAVDVHLTPHPGREEQRDAVLAELRYTVLTELCVLVSELGGAELEVTLENISAGHRFPSGAALDRRVWVELSAWSAEGALLWESGRGELDQPVSAWGGDTWLLRDQAFNRLGEPSHSFWELTDVTRGTLPGPSPLIAPMPVEDTHVTRAYRFGTDGVVARVELKVWMRPIGLELLQELIEGGDLSAEVLSFSTVLELEGASKIWRPDEAVRAISRSGREMLCLP